MMPITEFLSCTDLIDDFGCFSHQQKHHAKTYMTGLIAFSNIVIKSNLCRSNTSRCSAR
jgi:hypothetical protein